MLLILHSHQYSVAEFFLLIFRLLASEDRWTVFFFICILKTWVRMSILKASLLAIRVSFLWIFQFNSLADVLSTCQSFSYWFKINDVFRSLLQNLFLSLMFREASHLMIIWLSETSCYRENTAELSRANTCIPALTPLTCPTIFVFPSVKWK